MCACGVLVLAHGSRSHQWVSYIEQVVSSLDLTLPIEIGFLELVAGRGIADAVEHLEQAGVKKIIVVPLFITMGSTHLNEIQYALGIIPLASIETDLERIPHRCEMVWCSPLEDDPLVTHILSDRIKTLSQDPTKEWLLLLGHGSVMRGFNERWTKILDSLSSDLKRQFGFIGASFATLHPDNIRSQSWKLTSSYRVLTIPVFLSEGYFTRTLIPSKLVGNIYNGQTLLPHPLVAVWLNNQIRKSLTK